MPMSWETKNLAVQEARYSRSWPCRPDVPVERHRPDTEFALYSFTRVSAVLGMQRMDYFGQGSRG